MGWEGGVDVHSRLKSSSSLFKIQKVLSNMYPLELNLSV